MARRKKTQQDQKTNKDIIVNSINIKTLNRQSQDVAKWRRALKNADNGRRNVLYDLYTDILLDNVLSDAIDKRIEAIQNAELIFTVNNEPNEDIDKLMRTKAWHDMLRQIMLAQFWGFSLIEFDYSSGFKTYNVPRNHVMLNKHLILKNEYDSTGISYENDSFFLQINGVEKFGAILKSCPYVIYKRGDFGDWAQFAELFGMPFRIGKYNSYDEQTRAQLTEALEKAGSAAYAVIPKDGDIEYRDNQSKGDGGLYDTLRKACNEEVLVGILGQSMTTFQGDKGARSLGDVHMKVQQSKHATDRRFIASILNEEILPRLEERGYPVSGGMFDFPEIGETLSLKDKITIDKQLDEIIEIDPNYFYETYGVPIPKTGAAKKTKTNTEIEPKANTETKIKVPEEKNKKETMADSERTFWQKLFSFSFKPRAGRGAKFNYPGA